MAIRRLVQDPTTATSRPAVPDREFDPASGLARLHPAAVHTVRSGCAEIRDVAARVRPTGLDHRRPAVRHRGIGEQAASPGALAPTVAAGMGRTPGIGGAAGIAARRGSAAAGDRRRSGGRRLGEFAGLFAGGNPAAVSGRTAVALPPSLSSGRPGVGSLFTRAAETWP